ILPSTMFPVLLDQRFAIDPCRPSLHSSRSERVMSAGVPDATPTGKTSEIVKERVCFYSFCFYSQTKTALFILFEISRVQLVHKGLTRFGAVILEEVRASREQCDV